MIFSFTEGVEVSFLPTKGGKIVIPFRSEGITYCIVIIRKKSYIKNRGNEKLPEKKTHCIKKNPRI